MKKVFLVFAIAGGLIACNSKSGVELQQQRTIDSLNAVAAKQHAIDSMNALRKHEAPTTTTVTQSSQNTTTSNEAKKKGMSAPVKGALIGAGVGAVTGAIIDKKHPGQGAVIGGVVGAGAGAGTGAIIDKNQKKKESSNP